MPQLPLRQRQKLQVHLKKKLAKDLREKGVWRRNIWLALVHYSIIFILFKSQNFVLKEKPSTQTSVSGYFRGHSKRSRSLAATERFPQSLNTFQRRVQSRWPPNRVLRHVVEYGSETALKDTLVLEVVYAAAKQSTACSDC